MANDIEDFNIHMDEEQYYMNSIRDLKKYVASSKNPNTERKTQSTVKKFKEGFPDKKLEDFDDTQLDA